MTVGYYPSPKANIIKSEILTKLLLNGALRLGKKKTISKLQQAHKVVLIILA